MACTSLPTGIVGVEETAATDCPDGGTPNYPVVAVTARRRWRIANTNSTAAGVQITIIGARRDDPLQNVGEIRQRFDAVDLAGLDQGIGDCPATGSGVTARGLSQRMHNHRPSYCCGWPGEQGRQALFYPCEPTSV